MIAFDYIYIDFTSLQYENADQLFSFNYKISSSLLRSSVGLMIYFHINSLTRTIRMRIYILIKHI